jgi:hypothetical protein
MFIIDLFKSRRKAYQTAETLVGTGKAQSQSASAAISKSDQAIWFAVTRMSNPLFSFDIALNTAHKYTPEV